MSKIKVLLGKYKIKKLAAWIFGIALISILWGSAVFVIPAISKYIKNNSSDCFNHESCANLIATYGATGDMFGIATSLFSGLALLAVALTLWADSKSRREGRKPLLTTNLTEDSLILESPEPGENIAITLRATLHIQNLTSEAAINISVEGTIKNESAHLELPQKFLESPLGSGISSPIEINTRITGETLRTFLSSLTEQKDLQLILKTTYQSLENIHWETSATYIIKCTQSGQRQKLNSLRSNTEDFLDHWANNAAVSLNAEINGGSWTHKKI